MPRKKNVTISPAKPSTSAPPIQNSKSTPANENQFMANLGLQDLVGDEKFQNGLGEALGYGQFNAFNLPQGSGFPGTETISNTNTLFKNLRWYLVSNFRQLLSELYVELGLVQTIVDLPVDDALRGGITINSKQLDEDQIKELQISVKRDGDIKTIGQAAKWNRLFGGAGVLILTDQDPEEPLDIESITSDTPLEFRAVDMWELFWDSQNTEGYDPTLQENEFEHYNYYGEKIHKSRVMRMKGLDAPSFIRPRLRGWGFSVVESIVRSINPWLKSNDLIFEVLDEFKLDVYKIKNLVNTLMSPVGEQKIKQRVQMANWQKNYQNAIVMDSEDDFDHKQLSFAGLGEAQSSIRKQVASDLRMPVSKLFGSAENGGLTSTDQNDLENYNSMVESTVRDKIEFDILKMLEIKCQFLFGIIPDDLEIEFKPLRTLTAEQEENVKNAKFNRLLSARDKGEVTTFEFREGCNKGNLLDISLDNSGDTLNPDDPEVSDLVAEGSQDPEEQVDPGTGEAKVTPGIKDGTGGEFGGKKGEATSAKKPKMKNRSGPFFMPIRYTFGQRVLRRIGNSIEFDKAAYEADGGDAWIPAGKAPLFENPSNVDAALWARAKEASMKAFAKEKWQFVTWWYKKQGGKF